jgi:hypothetical protein
MEGFEVGRGLRSISVAVDRNVVGAEPGLTHDTRRAIAHHGSLSRSWDPPDQTHPLLRSTHPAWMRANGDENQPSAAAIIRLRPGTAPAPG